MLRRLPPIILLLVSLSGCFGGDDAGPTTTQPGDSTGAFEGVTFAILDTDDGARLRIQPGDEVVARLAVSTRSSPPWRVTRTPNPQILTTGDPLRITPSESEDGEPYDQIVFRAIAPGITTIEFEQSGSGRELTVTITVVAS